MSHTTEPLPGRLPLEAIGGIRLNQVLAAKRKLLRGRYDDPEVIDSCVDIVLDTLRRKRTRRRTTGGKHHP